MFTMKEACEQTHLPYETLKFYCNQGLVPNVKRDKNNRRIFDVRDIAWINSLNCLKNCGMSIAEMKEYIELCLIGALAFQNIYYSKALLVVSKPLGTN